MLLITDYAWWVEDCSHAIMSPTWTLTLMLSSFGWFCIQVTGFLWSQSHLQMMSHDTVVLFFFFNCTYLVVYNAMHPHHGHRTYGGNVVNDSYGSSWWHWMNMSSVSIVTVITSFDIGSQTMQKVFFIFLFTRFLFDLICFSAKVLLLITSCSLASNSLLVAVFFLLS